MKKILTTFKIFFGFALFWFAIFWLPKDISDWKDAAEPWKRLLSMVDQNTALWLFSTVCVLYILVIDIRRYREKNSKLPKPVVIDGIGRCYRIKEANTLLIKSFRNHKRRDLYLTKGVFDPEQAAVVAAYGLLNAAAREFITIYGIGGASGLHKAISAKAWVCDLSIEGSDAFLAFDSIFDDVPTPEFRDLVVSEKDFKRMMSGIRKAREAPEFFQEITMEDFELKSKNIKTDSVKALQQESGAKLTTR